MKECVLDACVCELTKLPIRELVCACCDQTRTCDQVRTHTHVLGLTWPKIPITDINWGSRSKWEILVKIWTVLRMSLWTRESVSQMFSLWQFGHTRIFEVWIWYTIVMAGMLAFSQHTIKTGLQMSHRFFGKCVLTWSLTTRVLT